MESHSYFFYSVVVNSPVETSYVVVSGTPSNSGNAFFVNSASSKSAFKSPVACKSENAFEKVSLAASTPGI